MTFCMKQMSLSPDIGLISAKAHKHSHKDIDASWTKKRGENHYGYKDHVKTEKTTKLIEKYLTTTASVHDSNVVEPLIDEKDKG